MLFICFYSPYNVAAQQQQHYNSKTLKNAFSELIDKGTDLIYNQGNYTGAIVYFDKILSVDPNNIDAIFFKGAALSSMGKSNESIPLINKAIILSDKALTTDPNNIDLLSIKGRALNRLQNYIEAIKYFDKVLAIDPNYKYALANKGLALDRLGNYTEAILYFNKALEIDPSFAYVLAIKGQALYEQGDYSEAVKYFDKALNIYPKNTNVLSLRAATIDNLNQQQSAESVDSSNNSNSNKNQHLIYNNSSVSDYTVMVYMIGSDLEAKSYAATKDIQEMEKVGSTPKVNVVVETGGGDNKTRIDSTRFIDFTKVQRHKILHNSVQTLANLGKKDMGDPNTLSDFIIWGMSNFPAKKYSIVLWDHGNGINGFGADSVFNNDKLTLDGMNEAFVNASKVTNKKFELIGFDSCLMASVEVADKLKSFGNYMVASEEIEPPWGWDYSSILTALNASPNQDGSSIGKKISDSFVVQSASISAAQGYDAQREITLSVVNLTKIVQLVNNLNLLANYLEDKVSDVNSAISLTKSIDSSEGYGKTSTGSSGLVDTYDLASNINQRFPQSANLVEAVQNSIRGTIIYKINGGANPSSHGLSIYAPISEEEFTGSRKYILDGWKGIMDLQYRLIKSDQLPPLTQSTLLGDTIRGHINANDVAKVTLWIYTSSMPEGNTAIYQDLDPSSFIKNDGSFEYKWNRQILSLCDNEKERQQICKPVSMKLETNKEKEFALIPARLTSNTDNVDEPVSLKYELNNRSKFTFLGARPEMKFEQTFQQGEQTVSKENWAIHKNDKIYPISYSFSSEEDNINDLPKTEYLPIQIKDKMAMPKYVSYNGSFDIHFMICDYSDNCLSNRWFHFNDTTYNHPQVVDLVGQKIPLCKSYMGTRNFSTYADPVYEFRLQYPSNWQKAVQTSRSLDDNVLEIRTEGSPRDNKDFVFVSVDAGYSPLTKKQFIDDINSSYNYDSLTKLVQFNPTVLGGYKAYKTVTITKGLGIKEDEERMQVDALIGHTDYNIKFTVHPSEFASYLPTINKILDSFELCATKGTDIHIGQDILDTKLNQNQTNTNIANITTDNHKEPNPEFSTYTNPIYGFKMKYISNSTVTEDRNKSGVTFDFLTIVQSRNPFLLVHADKNGLYLGCYVLKDIIKQGATLYEFAQYLLHIKGKQEVGVNVTESKLINFHAHPAYKIVYTSLDPFYKQQIKHMYIITTIGYDGYFFDYSGEVSNYEQYLSVGESMLNSFQPGPTAAYR